MYSTGPKLAIPAWHSGIMATFYDAIEPQLAEFLRRQHVFFVATAASDGRVNVSPKGLDSFRILDERRVAWVNGTGSGNETAAHVLRLPRMTILFASFDAQPGIVRLYGSATMIQPGDQGWAEASDWFPAMLGARQVFVLAVEQIQRSCGFGVPRYAFEGERDLMRQWAAGKGEEGIAAYQAAKNTVSIDGFDTGLPRGRRSSAAPGVSAGTGA